MGGKGSSKIEVNRYLMSMHVGVCLGPVDAITAAYYGEKKYWTGYNTANRSYSISNTGLFGGDKKEGGVEGQMTILMGRSDQVLPDNLAQKLGRDNGLDCPGFRGVTSVFHTGPSSGGRGGWYWAANSPYLKGLWYSVMAIPKTLGAENSRINPTAADTYFRSDGFCIFRSYYGLYDFMMNLGSKSLSELVVIADTVETSAYSGKPHSIEITGGSDGSLCKVFNGFESDPLTGRVIAGLNQYTGNDICTPYGLLKNKDGLTVATIYESYTLPPGTITSGGEAYRPSAPEIRPDPSEATYDANPAHIIYEVMTNTQYGMGQDTVAIDTQSFVNAGQVLFDEGLGLSMAWATSTAAGEFIEEVKDHINALVFPDPETGKMTIKLVRDDYDARTLRTVDPNNATLTSFSRKAWGDTINEIVVTWTNPASEQEETVTLQDNGNIAEQGEVISDAKNYYGVRSADLAWKLAARELRVASAPLCSAEIELDRSFWNIRPGDCLKVTWPEYGMTDLVMRVWEVKYGSGRTGGGKITVSVTEDIFSLPVSAFVQPPSTEWVDTSSDPQPFATTRVMTMPIYMASKVGGVSAGAFEYPVAYAGLLAAAPNPDTTAFELVGQALDATGTTAWERRGARVVTGHGTLLADMNAEAVSLVSAFNIDSGDGPSKSVFVLIGGGTDAQAELALIMSQSSSGWTVRRGVLDTVPRAWPSGTPVWFMSPDFLFADDAQQAAGSSPSYKLLANTSRGQLAEGAAPVVTCSLTDRIHRPLRPANLKVENVGFEHIDLPIDGKVDVTWSRRNRLTEETVVMSWTDADVTPESGQTTTLVLVNADTNAEVGRFADLTGTSTEVDILAALASAGVSPSAVFITAEASRDSLISLQSHRIKVVLPGGYGLNYGVSYG